MIGFDKLATLERAAIAGKIGDAPVEWLPLTARLFSRFSVSGSGNGRESLARKLGARRGASYLMPQILPMQSSKPGPSGPGLVADLQYGRSASVISGRSQTTKLSESPSRCHVSMWRIV